MPTLTVTSSYSQASFNCIFNFQLNCKITFHRKPSCALKSRLVPFLYNWLYIADIADFTSITVADLIIIAYLTSLLHRANLLSTIIKQLYFYLFTAFRCLLLDLFHCPLAISQADPVALHSFPAIGITSASDNKNFSLNSIKILNFHLIQSCFPPLTQAWLSGWGACSEEWGHGQLFTFPLIALPALERKGLTEKR